MNLCISGSTAPTMARDGKSLGRKAKPPVSQMAGGFALNAHREKCVMSGRNWSRLKQRSLMRRRGVEDVKGDTPIAAPLGNRQQRRQLNKAELREQAEAAVLAWRAGQTSKNK
jgi:hypothetical protein